MMNCAVAQAFNHMGERFQEALHDVGVPRSN